MDIYTHKINNVGIDNKKMYGLFSLCYGIRFRTERGNSKRGQKRSTHNCKETIETKRKQPVQ